MLKPSERLATRSWTTTLLLSGALVMGCEPQGADPGDPDPAGQASQTDPAATPAPGAAAPGSEVATPGETAAREPTRTALADSANVPESGEVIARAELEPKGGSNVSGVVEFTPGADGELEIMARIEGLDAGAHGFHVHEIGDCSGPESAGDHYAPDGDPHGAPESAPGEHHAGDLGNVMADESGAAEMQMSDDELQLTGRYGIVDRAVIVHANEDDLTSQPGGGSGDPVACGVIELVTEQQRGQTTEPAAEERPIA